MTFFSLKIRQMCKVTKSYRNVVGIGRLVVKLICVVITVALVEVETSFAADKVVYVPVVDAVVEFCDSLQT